MHYYRVFGRLVASQLESNELVPAPAGEPDVSISIASRPVPPDPLPHLGTERINDDVDVVLRGSPERYRLEYDDTGVFEIEQGGRSIVWYPPVERQVDHDDVRRDLFGRVMALALHAVGIPTLHASGVALGNSAAAFIGPKLFGKSTIAGALQRAGARVLGDDAIAVTVEDQPLVLPGVPVVEVWPDTADWLAGSSNHADAHGKLRVGGPADGAASRPVPLGALYLLRPVPEDTSAEVVRERVPPMAATLALLGQTKIGPLLGSADAGSLLDQVVHLAEKVPVYRLSYPRDFSLLDEVVARMAQWHDAPLSVAGTTA